jgi:flagellar hook protein FlgE
MIRSYFTGLSSMSTYQTGLEVVANNIANANTTGFKTSRISFQDLFSQTLNVAGAPSEVGGGMNPVQVGSGVQLGSITTDFTQGSVKFTGTPTDLAVMGDGFLIVSDGRRNLFTRDGALMVDAAGRLVHTSSGWPVQGMMADANGVIPETGPLTDLTIPIGTTLNAEATTRAELAGNLQADAAVGDTANTLFRVIDSQGNSHDVTVTFTKSAANEWTWAATSEGNTVGTGTLTFDADGRVSGGSTGSLSLTLTNGAVTPLNATLQLGSLTQLASSSSVSVTNRDGFPPGFLDSVSVDQNGVINAVFTNGQAQPLGRVFLARFANPTGLMRQAENLMVPSVNSGEPQFLQPGDAGTGTIQSGALELSNVDVATELTNVMLNQRGFQAAARIITASDELVQDALGLIR